MMMMMRRMTIRLTILVLAGFGAKTLYDKYATKAKELQEPSREFLDRATSAVVETAEQVSGAARGMTDEIGHAAADAADEAQRRLDSAVHDNGRHDAAASPAATTRSA